MKSEKRNVLFTKEASLWFKWAAVVMVVLSHFAEWWSWFIVEEGNRETIRFALSRMGPYGVAVFLLFSGYGLAKSAGTQRIHMKFILKRITGVYIPYLIVVILLEFCSGNFHSLEDLSDIWYGQEFWYMTVLFTLYLAFMGIWLLFKNCRIRAGLMLLFVGFYIGYLYYIGKHDFWYISNLAFVIGVLLALYEKEVLQLNQKIKAGFTIVFGIISVYTVYCALFTKYRWSGLVETGIRMCTVTAFTFFIACLASYIKVYDPVGRFLGKYSLYFYLLHTFLFMWTVNYFKCEIRLRFIIAAFIILIVSVLMGTPISRLTTGLNKKIESCFK